MMQIGSISGDGKSKDDLVEAMSLKEVKLSMFDTIM